MQSRQSSEKNSDRHNPNTALLLLALSPLLNDLADRKQRHDRAKHLKNKGFRFLLGMMLGRIAWNRSLSEAQQNTLKACVQSLVLSLPESSAQSDYAHKILSILLETRKTLIETRRDHSKTIYSGPGHAEIAIQAAITASTALHDSPNDQLSQLPEPTKHKIGEHLSCPDILEAVQDQQYQKNTERLKQKLQSIPKPKRAFKKEDIAWMITALLITAATVFLISPWAPWSFGPTAMHLIQIYIGTDSYATACGFGCLATVFVTLLFIKAVIAPCLNWCAQKIFNNNIETADSETPNSDEKPDNLWAINPIARMWLGIAKFTEWFYYYGLKHPIAMTLYTSVYFCTIIDIFNPFLPWHTFNLSIFSSLANPATISLVTGSIITAFFLGKLTLAICSLVQERAESPLIKNPLRLFSDNSKERKEALKMLASIAFGVLVLCPIIWGQAQIPWIVAHAGSWLIFDLLMFNIKPLAILADTCSNFKSSLLGSTVHMITLPLRCLFEPSGYRRLFNDFFKIMIRAALAIPDMLLNKFIFPIPHVLVKGFCASVTCLLSLFRLLPGVPKDLPARFELLCFSAERECIHFHERSKKFFKDCVTKGEDWVDRARPLPTNTFKIHADPHTLGQESSSAFKLNPAETQWPISNPEQSTAHSPSTITFK